MESKRGAMVIMPVAYNNVKPIEEEIYFLGMRAVKRYDKSEVLTLLGKKIVVYVIYCDNQSTCEYLKRNYEFKH